MLSLRAFDKAFKNMLSMIAGSSIYETVENLACPENSVQPLIFR